jgi:hypothetical protein
MSAVTCKEDSTASTSKDSHQRTKGVYSVVEKQ